MSLWFNFDATVSDSIKELYVIDTLDVVDHSKFIILTSPHECPDSRALAIVTDREPPNIERFYTIISPKRLKNVSAHSIYLIPHRSRLWFYYHIPVIEVDDLTYCEQIFSNNSFHNIYSSQLFNNLMKMLLSGSLSTEIIRYIVNLGYVKYSKDEFHISDITDKSLGLYRNDKHVATIPNYFYHFNGPLQLYSDKSSISIDAKMCELLFVWVFYSDGIPYIPTKRYYFVNNGIFNSARSSSLYNWPADVPNSVFIQSMLTPKIDGYNLYCNFSYNGNYTKTYMSNLRYITTRSIISNMPDLLPGRNLSRQYSSLKTWEVAIIYKKFAGTKLFDHEMMNFMNFGSILYETYLFKSYNTHMLVTDEEKKVIEMIFSTNGMNWTMEKDLYPTIASYYNKTLECFGTSQNHTLVDYCDPFNRSFFQLTNKDIALYDCLIINPPYTEFLFVKTINHMFKYLFREKKISIYLFLPLWYDMNNSKNLLIPYRRSYHFPKSKAYDLKNSKRIMGVSSQLFFVSNQEVSRSDNQCLRDIITTMIR